MRINKQDVLFPSAENFLDIESFEPNERVANPYFKIFIATCRKELVDTGYAIVYTKDQVDYFRNRGFKVDYVVTGEYAVVERKEVKQC